MNVERLLRIGEASMGLALGIMKLVRSGRAERLSKILPDELLTTLERKRAEVEALARYSAEGDEG